MGLTSEENIKYLLKKHGLRPLKKFGQNFLIDETSLKTIIDSADLDSSDIVLEVGPGIGAITQALAQKAGRVIAIEKDREMVKILKETLKEFKNVEIINDDIRLTIKDFRNPTKLRGISEINKSYKVVGNLPFYLTAPVIRRFLEMEEARPLSMTLVVQKEVAQRICAKPPHMSILANAVQFYADPELISVISKKSFFPEPKVDAALIKITPRPAPMGDSKMFFEVVKAGFSHPRKQLLNNLAVNLKINKEAVKSWLQKNSLDPTQRAETLSMDDWLRLIKNCDLTN